MFDTDTDIEATEDEGPGLAVLRAFRVVDAYAKARGISVESVRQDIVRTYGARSGVAPRRGRGAGVNTQAAVAAVMAELKTGPKPIKDLYRPGVATFKTLKPALIAAGCSLTVHRCRLMVEGPGANNLTLENK